jgi:hypothetical protein
VTDEDRHHQMRGRLVADVRAAVERIEAGGPVVVIAETPDQSTARKAVQGDARRPFGCPE